MNAYASGNGARICELARGVGFSEGPVVTPNGEIYVTSITHGRVYCIGNGAEVHGEVGGGANGAALDSDGVLYVAQNGGRWARTGPRWGPNSVGGIQRVTPDSGVSWLTREPIAPNDLCFGPDGMLYVTDPTRAPGSHDGRIWRVDPVSGVSELLISVTTWFPNGIAFGPDGRLYVAATDTSSIHRFEIVNGNLMNEQIVIQMRQGYPDGIAFDADGNLVIAAIARDVGSGAIQTWSLEGALLDTFSPGTHRAYTNVAFTPGGDLVVTDSDGEAVLLAKGWPVAGLPLYPFRS